MYKAKSLNGAQRRVRELEKQVARWRDVAERFNEERVLMAKLASDKPEFYNPIVAMEAKQLRDRILGK